MTENKKLSKQTKTRLDQKLVDLKLAESRTQAKSLILAGEVLVNEEPVTKVGTLVADGAVLRVKEKPKYVSRGGLKLEKALSEFCIDVTNSVCVDIGASTGGFTDCLFKHGAKKVYCIDVGYGQLHWSLQSDNRVVRFDRENFRNFDVNKIVDEIDVAVMDVSFISMTLLVAKVVEILRRGTARRARQFMALIKPQFEVGPQHIGKGGIVRDVAARERALENCQRVLTEAGFTNLRVTESPITGADGNVEYLVAGDFAENYSVTKLPLRVFL